MDKRKEKAIFSSIRLSLEEKDEINDFFEARPKLKKSQSMGDWILCGLRAEIAKEELHESKEGTYGDLG